MLRGNKGPAPTTIPAVSSLPLPSPLFTLLTRGQQIPKHVVLLFLPSRSHSHTPQDGSRDINHLLSVSLLSPSTLLKESSRDGSTGSPFSSPSLSLSSHSSERAAEVSSCLSLFRVSLPQSSHSAKRAAKR